MSTEATQRKSSLCTDGSIAVPLGYKRTAVGAIPENWEVRTLGSLGQFKNGINKGKQDFGHGFPFVNLMDVFGVPKVSTDSSFGLVNSSLGEREAYALQSGDVLFVRSSVKPEGVGLTILIPEDLPNTVFSGFLIRYRENGVLALEFKEHCFWEAGFRNRLIASSTVSANTNINQEALKLLQLAFPPNKAEQRAIAEALSDVDGLLGALEALIAKKRAIKQAAMQQLLTGQLRLSGFNGEWQLLNIGQHSLLNARIGWQGLTTAEYLSTGTHHLVTGTDFSGGKVNWSTCPFVSAERYDQDRNIQLRANDVLLTKDGTIGKVAFVDVLPVPATLNSGVFVIRPKDNAYEPKFLFYILTSSVFDDFLTKLQAGSTISHLYQKDFVSFAFLAPPTSEEQRDIASVLTDMDAEIAALEQRREQTRAIKQGMMQQLLTGRIRLVKPEQPWQ